MKTLLAAMGLAALVAGCENNETFTQAECTVKGIKVEIQYERRGIRNDKVHFYFGIGGSNIESYADDTKATFTCDDGRVLNFENGDVYWGAKINSESQ